MVGPVNKQNRVKYTLLFVVVLHKGLTEQPEWLTRKSCTNGIDDVTLECRKSHAWVVTRESPFAWMQYYQYSF